MPDHRARRHRVFRSEDVRNAINKRVIGDCEIRVVYATKAPRQFDDATPRAKFRVGQFRTISQSIEAEKGYSHVDYYSLILMDAQSGLSVSDASFVSGNLRWGSSRLRGRCAACRTSGPDGGGAWQSESPRSKGSPICPQRFPKAR